jgi:ribonuclease HII
MACRLAGLIGGIDEAGRGPLAGPVVSSCVVWKDIDIPQERIGVKDSKLLSGAERSRIFPWISSRALKVGVGIATHEEIDTLNILKASLLSMERALEDTGLLPDVVLVDGKFRLPSFPHSKPVVRGDRKCFFIAAASIIAKVVRDDIMDRYHRLYPEYGFDRNRGYPTAEHRGAIKTFGASPIHRKTFKGVREYLAG